MNAGTVSAVVFMKLAIAFIHDLPDYVYGWPNAWVAGPTVTVFAIAFGALPFALERWGLGRGLTAAVLLYCLYEIAGALHALALDWISDVGSSQIGGGFWLTSRSGATSADGAEPIAGSQLLALGTFVLLTSFAIVMLGHGRVVLPWPECVVATILLYTTWRSAYAGAPETVQPP